MARPGLPRIAILGAGPIGVEAALQTRSAGFPTIVFERGDLGEAIGHWGHVRLFTPFGMVTTSTGLELIKREHPQQVLPQPGDYLTGIDYRDQYLIPLGLTSVLADVVNTKTTVLSVTRSGILKTDGLNDSRRGSAQFRILVRNEKGEERVEFADIVLDCCGTYGRHSWLGDGGGPAVGELAAEKLIAYGVDDILGRRKAHYAGKSTIVIGAGYSAATTVSLLAQLAEEHNATWTIWLSRGPRSTPLPRIANDPYRERDRLAARANNLATRGDGNVEFRAQTIVQEVVSNGPDKGFRVAALCQGKPMTWEVDRVVANIGHMPDSWMTQELHVDHQQGNVRQPEPNYFCLGMKSMGRNSNFLLKKGFEQIAEVMSILARRKA